MPALINGPSGISDISGELISTFNHHRTDPRLFSPFAIVESRGYSLLLPHFFYWLKQLRHGLSRNPPSHHGFSSCHLGTPLLSYTLRPQCAPHTNTPCPINFISAHLLSEQPTPQLIESMLEPFPAHTNSPFL